MPASRRVSTSVRRAFVVVGLVAVIGALAVAHLRRTRLPSYTRDDLEVLVIPEIVPGVPAPPWRMEPASEAGARVLQRLAEITRATRVGRYEHHTHVDEARGEYLWDCSGMTGWILEREAPAVMRGILASRPRARDFARAITHAPTDHARHGLRRIESAFDVRAGDVFAWERPPGMPSTSTGHVGFVLSSPVPALGVERAVSMRVADSTTLPHDADSRLVALDHDGGLGEGTMTFLLDEAGRATAYGWHGTLSPIYVVTPVVFGRLE